jgi:REP element-mobilizing transposase RayT
MMKDKLFADTYRTETLRLPEWDYSEPGSYFVTICTKGFRQYFGQVQEDKMILNTYGRIIQQEIKNIESNEVEIDSYIIMPNHVHMIISINENYRRDNSRIISP